MKIALNSAERSMKEIALKGHQVFASVKTILEFITPIVRVRKKESMQIDPAQLEVIHDLKAKRFEIKVNSLVAQLDYILTGDTIVFTHTGVPSPLEGQGVGAKLARAGLEYARDNSLNVKSVCWFVSLYIKRHPEQLAQT